MYKFRITDISLDKELSVILKSIYGLGWYKVFYILSFLGFSYPFITNNFNIYYKDILFFYLEDYVISKARIDRYITLRIKKLKDLKTYKGTRHSLFLPVHGQRTRTNANTQRSHRRILEDIKKAELKIKKK